MKTANLTIALLLAGAQLSWGSLRVEFAATNPADLTIPAFAITSGQSKVVEYGCPIEQERRSESNRKLTLKNLVSECIEQVSQAAAQKPNVTGVIRTSLIASDVTFQEMSDGSRIVNGTIFLQSVVAMSVSGQ